MIKLQHDHEHMTVLLDLMIAVSETTNLQAAVCQAIDHLIARDIIIAGGVWLVQSSGPAWIGGRNIEPDRLLPEIQQAIAADSPEPPAWVYQREARLTVLPLRAASQPIGALAVVTHSLPDPADLLLRAVAVHLGAVLGGARLGQRDETSDRAWEEFLSHAAHEIKNPLASIKGYADLLLRRAAKDLADPYQKGLTTISQQVGRTTKLLEQLSDMTRIGVGRMPMDRHTGDFAALVARVVKEYQSANEQHTISFDRGDRALPCRFDEQRIYQVVDAMLGNSIKFSPDGAAIAVMLRRSDAEGGAPIALLAVSDTGVGVPEGEQERVFERFFRGSNVRGTYSGMGIGLYIARAILDLHGGRIWLESERGQGTTCFATLPLVSTSTRYQKM